MDIASIGSLTDMHLPLLPLEHIPSHFEANALWLNYVKRLEWFTLGVCGINVIREILVLHFGRRNSFTVRRRIQRGRFGRIVRIRDVNARRRVGREVDVNDLFGVGVDDRDKVEWVSVEVFVLSKARKHQALLQPKLFREAVVISY
jgi:hypothetical protein